jgi:hypothetical protein
MRDVNEFRQDHAQNHQGSCTKYERIDIGGYNKVNDTQITELA